MKNQILKEDIASLCLELSLLLHAGVGMGGALHLLAEDSAHKEILTSMAEKVDEGTPLHVALRESGVFPMYVSGLVEVGERTGRTEEALSSLSRYYEGRIRMERRVRSAILYPAVMLVLMLIVIGVLLVKVLPIFDDVYASLGGRMSGVAGGLLNLGRWLDSVMPVLWVLLAVLVILACACAMSESFRAKLLAGWQKRWGDKGVCRKLNNARLAQAMAMGMTSGLPFDEAVALSAGLMEGGAKERCMECQHSLEDGKSLSEALKSSGLLPPNQSRLLEIGQRSGAGDTSMEKIASDLTEDSEAALDALVGRVEPALVLVCSLLVGLILLSVMLPLMNIMATIG